MNLEIKLLLLNLIGESIHIWRGDIIKGVIPIASPAISGLMDKEYVAVSITERNAWYEVSGNGAFFLIMHHPLTPYSGILFGVVNGYSPSSVARIVALWKETQFAVIAKAKSTPSDSPKVYFKTPNPFWVKLVPLSGGLEVKLTEDTVEE